MTLKNFLRGLGRRWYVLLVGLLITGVACAFVASEVQPTYQRSATLLLLPAASSVPEGGNAYLYLGGLGQASEVLVNTMAAQTVRASLLDGHPAADVTVERNVTSSGPLLSVTATGGSDSEVAEVLDRALAAVQSNLTALQRRADVPSDARISSMSLTTDTASTLLQRNRLESVAGTAIAGVALTLLLTGFVDGLLLSSARRRRSTTGSGPERPANPDLDLDFDPDPDGDTDESAGLLPARHTTGRKPVSVSAHEPEPATALAPDAGAEEYARERDDIDRGAGSLERGSRATEHAE